MYMYKHIYLLLYSQNRIYALYMLCLCNKNLTCCVFVPITIATRAKNFEKLTKLLNLFLKMPIIIGPSPIIIFSYLPIYLFNYMYIYVLEVVSFM